MTTIAVAGQALMQEPVTPDGADGQALVAVLRAADLAISNFEGTLADAGSVATKAGLVHAADPGVPAGMAALGISAVTLANNHMYDFGPAGIVASRKAMADVGLMAAGAGANTAEAGAPAIRSVGALRVALIGADCGPQPDVVYASATHAGINPLRVRRKLVVPGDDAERLRAIAAASSYPLWRQGRQTVGMPVPNTGDADDFFGLAVETGKHIAYTAQADAADLEQLLAAIRQARTQADLVNVVLHNHHWEPDWSATPDWLPSIIAALVDAGAGLVACHGAPVLGGMAFIAGAPVYFGLGNLVFHSRPARAVRYKAAGFNVWDSIIATHHFDDAGALSRIDIVPVQAGKASVSDPDTITWTAPRLLCGDAGRAVLEAFLARSGINGHQAIIDADQAVLTIIPRSLPD